MATTTQALADSCSFDTTANSLMLGGNPVTPDSDVTGTTGSTQVASGSGWVLMMDFVVLDATVKTSVTVTGLAPVSVDHHAQLGAAFRSQYGAIDNGSKLKLPANNTLVWSTNPPAQVRGRIWLARSAPPGK